MSNSAKNITILGGGTSAWLMAAFLSSKLPKDYFNLSIIEGSENKPIGVGESTLPYFINFMEVCGFKLEDWFNFCNCTPKAGVGYKDWIKPNSIFWHPFAYMPLFENKYTLFDILTYLKIDKSSYPKYFQNYQRCILKNQPPENLQAVHIDATKLSLFIKNNINIKIISKDIVDIKYSSKGIKSLILNDKSFITSDIFIDCLGFNSIIKKLNSSYNFKSCSHLTPVNAAIFNPIKYTDKSLQLTPYTESKCTPYGWIWKTPLQSRIGAGMVFNKDISNKEEVIKWYQEYFGKENLINEESKYIEFSPGYFTNPWNKNTVSVGLSTGFIEPLEATGIQTIINNIINFFEIIEKGFYTKQDINLYNNTTQSQYKSAYDFISIHYLNNFYSSSFWKYSRNLVSLNITKSLKLKLNYFKNYNYNINLNDKNELFSNYSWYYTILQFTNIKPKTKIINNKNFDQLLNNYLKHEN